MLKAPSKNTLSLCRLEKVDQKICC